MLVKTNLYTTRESARLIRFEPVSGNAATNVQEAIGGAPSGGGGSGGGGSIGTARLPTFASTITINNNDTEVGIDTGSGAVVCNLPSVFSYSSTEATGLELCVFDFTGHAAAHNITFVLNGTDIFTQGISPVINANFGLVKLRPIITAGGPNQWYVRGIN